MSLLMRRRMLLNAIQVPVNIFDESQSSIEGIRNETVVKGYGLSVFINTSFATKLKPNTIYKMSYNVEYVTKTTNGAVGFALVDRSSSSSQINLYYGEAVSSGTVTNRSYIFKAPENINSGTWNFYAYTGFIKNEDGTNTSAEVIFRNVQFVECENLFDIDKAELKDCALIDGKIIASNGNACVDIKLPAGTYFIALTKSTSFSVYLRNGKVASGYLSIISDTGTTAKFNFTASVDGYLRISWLATGESISNIQIAEAEKE